MKTRRGEVVLVLFPNSDLRTAKRRPALVPAQRAWQRPWSDDRSDDISNLARSGHESRVTIMVDSAQGRESGLRIDSVVMTDNVATVLDSEIHSRLGKISNMAAIDAALKYTFGLA